MQVRLILCSYDSVETEYNMVDVNHFAANITDWETITEEEFALLQKNKDRIADDMCKSLGVRMGEYSVLLLIKDETSIIERIKQAKAYADKQLAKRIKAKKEREKAKKLAQQKKKQKKIEQERKLLEELKNKYKDI